MNTTSRSPDLATVRTNPIWAALTSGNRDIAQGGPLAFRYPTDVAPFAAVETQTPEAIAAMLALLPEGGRFAFFGPRPFIPPSGCEVQFSAPLLQMELTGPLKQRTNAIEIIELGETDVPDMAELTQLTRPGPFGPRTHSLGRYIGIRMDGRLAAMAGERMRFSDRVEISAVCTHPDFRGRGFGEYLVGIMVNALIQEGKVPLLHVLASNIGAIALYERLGFKPVHHGHVVFYGRSPA